MLLEIKFSASAVWNSLGIDNLCIIMFATAMIIYGDLKRGHSTALHGNIWECLGAQQDSFVNETVASQTLRQMRQFSFVSYLSERVCLRE